MLATLMSLSQITLQNFRNHAQSALENTAHFNLLVGENGAGKTNVLEAISLLSPGRGLRRAASDRLPLRGAAGPRAVSAVDRPSIAWALLWRGANRLM